MARIIIDRFGTKKYYSDNKFHRDDGPAIIEATGVRFWYRHGKISCTKNPSEWFHDGTVRWRLDDFFHRDNGPYYDTPNGLKLWRHEGIRVWPELK